VEGQPSAAPAENEKYKRAGPASPRPTQREANFETGPARWQRDLCRLSLGTADGSRVICVRPT
jgi:hypothetical protein